jgi:8-oxo-dGTP diphosphatase
MHTSERHTNIVASFLFLTEGNKVLLVKRANTGYHDGDYSLTAGHVDPGETYTQAMIRETKEEIGITLKEEDIEVVHIQHRKSSTDGSERVDAYFSVDKWDGEIVNCEEDKCSDISWFDLDDLPENMVPCVKLAINSIRKKKHYSEYGWK